MADRLTRQQRSALMSMIRGRDTRPERRLRSELHARGLRFNKHVGRLPGRPDVVFPRARVAVFVDGDFWHGYRFPSWKDRLSPYWVAKIERNRRRDVRNFAALRRAGWKVIRVWEHEIDRNLAAAATRICEAVRDRHPSATATD